MVSLPKITLSRRKTLIGAGFALGVGGLVWGLSGRTAVDTSTAKAAVDRPVLVTLVHVTPRNATRSFVGTLRARMEADLGFRVAGKIASRKAQAGDKVKAGDVLATLDDADFTLQRDSAQAELQAAQSAEKQALAELNRIRDLRLKGWSTEQNADRQKAIYDEAVGRRVRAERQASLASNSLSYTQLKADSDGIVTALLAEAGQVVAAGQPVFRIARTGDREAQIAIPEHELALARMSGASVALWSDPTHAHAAHLREIAPSADAATRTFQARYSIEGLPLDAELGMTVTLSLKPGNPSNVARVPLSALLDEGKGTDVLVVDPATSTIERRKVVIDSYDAQNAIISAGLKDGDQVIILGIHKLQAGQKVRVQLEKING